MANIKSAEKRIAVTRKKTAQNRSVKSELNTLIKKFKANPSQDNLAVIFSEVDKAAKENIIHANKANRLKASLSKLVVAK